MKDYTKLPSYREVQAKKAAEKAIKDSYANRETWKPSKAARLEDLQLKALSTAQQHAVGVVFDYARRTTYPTSIGSGGTGDAVNYTSVFTDVANHGASIVFEHQLKAEPAPKFKVGDKVMVTRPYGRLHLGDVLTVRALTSTLILRVDGNVSDMNIWADCVEPISQEQTPDADGWIPWSGGECPIGLTKKCEVKFRFGGTSNQHAAGRWNWSRSACAPNCEIIAYRVI